MEEVLWSTARLQSGFLPCNKNHWRGNGQASLKALLPVNRHRRKSKLCPNKQTCLSKAIEKDLSPVLKEKKKKKKEGGQYWEWWNVLFSVLLSSWKPRKQRGDIWAHPAFIWAADKFAWTQTAHSAVPEVIKSASVVQLVPKAKRSFLQKGLQKNYLMTGFLAVCNHNICMMCWCHGFIPC